MTYIICLNNKYYFTEADQQEASNLYHITRKIIYLWQSHNYWFTSTFLHV